jgi:hypothetical protein
MRFNLFAAAATLLIAATAFAADTTKFFTPNGTVSVSVRVLGAEPGPLAPGDLFDAVVLIENQTNQRIELMAPTFEVRCTVHGEGYSWHVPYTTHAFIGAGASVQQVIRLQVPVDADYGSRMKVGLLVGLAPNMSDFRSIFTVVDLATRTGPVRQSIEKTRNGR